MSIHAQRLLNVALALREVPDVKSFTMRRYMNECGTPACAIGHYAGRLDLQDLLCIRDGNFSYVDPKLGEPDYDDPVVLDHFGIDEEEAEELFGGYGCGQARAPIEAAEYIEGFVKRKWDVDPAVRKLTADLQFAQREFVL